MGFCTIGPYGAIIRNGPNADPEIGAQRIGYLPPGMTVLIFDQIEGRNTQGVSRITEKWYCVKTLDGNNLGVTSKQNFTQIVKSLP